MCGALSIPQSEGLAEGIEGASIRGEKPHQAVLRLQMLNRGFMQKPKAAAPPELQQREAWMRILGGARGSDAEPRSRL